MVKLSERSCAFWTLGQEYGPLLGGRVQGTGSNPIHWVRAPELAFLGGA